MFVALTVVPAAADTYRWKDKDGNTHYGRIVPPEYAHLPYDVLNDAGIVIDHVDDPTQSADAHAMELAEEVEEKKRAPLISEKERQLEADRLLVVQYDSEEEILDLLDKELAHQETDKTIIRHSFTSTNTAIREQIGLAADQQRAGIEVNEDKLLEIKRLYARLDVDKRRLEALEIKEQKIRDRFEGSLERYRYLTRDKTQDSDQG
jgi:hypothetical protein